MRSLSSLTKFISDVICEDGCDESVTEITKISRINLIPQISESVNIMNSPDHIVTLKIT